MPTFNELQKTYWHESGQKRRDPKDPIIRAYVEPKLEFIRKRISTRTFKILELGAGTGYFSYYLEKIGDLTATDYSPAMLDQNPALTKCVADARDLSMFPDKSFDVVFCHALLHHIDTQERATVVTEMQRVSRQYIVVIEPNRNNPLMYLFGLLKREEHGSLDFSPPYLRWLFSSADRNLEICSFGLLTPNRMPIPKFLLPIEKKIFERPLWGGISNIVISTLHK